MKHTSLQKFTMQKVLRSEIIQHPKNPRVITELAKKNLRKKMKEVGLLQPLMVNKRNMYLLGGHQRLAVMDSIERYKEGGNDYSLDVAMVDLAEKEELEMLVFLNNPSAQGGWDKDILAELNTEFDVTFDGMGFDRLDVDLLFDGDARFSRALEDTQEVVETKDILNEIKELRKESTDRMKKEQSIDWMFTVVCKTEVEKRELLELMHIPHYERFVSSASIKAIIAKNKLA